MHMPRRVLLLLAAVIGQGLAITLVGLAPAAESGGGYYWPSGRGVVGKYSSSSFRVAPNLSASLAWTWHGPKSRYSNSPVGTNIDGQRNIYLTSLDGIRKFSPDGTLLWTYLRRSQKEELPDTASLYENAIYCSTTAGRIFALSMETGQELWSTQLPSTDGNNGWVSAHEDVVITGSDARDEYHGGSGNGKVADQFVTGLNSTDGRVLWNFRPEAPLWNFAASFAGDGTFVFQDFEARAYRCRVADGQLLWKSGGIVGSWTDGSAILGPNSVVYTVGNFEKGAVNRPGQTCAHRLQDGESLWCTKVPQPPNNMPAIGRIAGFQGLSLVQPIGQQIMPLAPTAVYALDAETGKVQWIFDGPRQMGLLQAGDRNPQAMSERTAAGIRAITLPNPWSAPSIDAAGTVFIGSQEGPLFALRDENHDGRVAGSGEVYSYETGAAFSGSSSPALAEGLMAVASIDQLYVFKQ